jgi:hypothetical protein
MSHILLKLTYSLSGTDHSDEDYCSGCEEVEIQQPRYEYGILKISKIDFLKSINVDNEIQIDFYNFTNNTCTTGGSGYCGCENKWNCVGVEILKNMDSGIPIVFNGTECKYAPFSFIKYTDIDFNYIC